MPNRFQPMPPNAIVYGHPTDDPGCKLWCIEKTPPAEFKPPWPAILFFPVGGFKSFDPLPLGKRAAIFNRHGYLTRQCTLRGTVVGVQGQTTTGQFPQPILDGAQAIAHTRDDDRVIADRVYVIGGSAGANIAGELCTRAWPEHFDAGVALSPPTNFAERRSEPYDTGDYFLKSFVQNVNRYCPNDQLANSLVSHIAADCSPFLYFMSERDSMPFHQYSDLDEIDVWEHVVSRVIWDSSAHAYTYWNEVEEEILSFFNAGGNAPTASD